jgi:RNA polymerase sigma-70 factor, ECF subfamily
VSYYPRERRASNTPAIPRLTAGLQLVTDDGDHEWQLVRRAAAGDQAAFEALYHAHAPRVYGLCLRMSGSQARAVELTQDVFVHLWERIGSFRGEAALSSWIHRVTVNVVLNDARRIQRRERHERTEDRDDDSEASELEHRASVRPASVLEAVDLERAIATLPEGARVVFVLHDVEGYRHEEIARMTGTAEGTCRAQLHRARKLLMEELDR